MLNDKNKFMDLIQTACVSLLVVSALGEIFVHNKYDNQFCKKGIDQSFF